MTISLNRSGPLYAGTGLSIMCTATLDPSVNNDENVFIKWSGQERIPSTRFSISSTTNHPCDRYSSVLTISPLAVQDNGPFTCTWTVTGLDQSQSATNTSSTNVNVIGEHTRHIVSVLINLLCSLQTSQLQWWSWMPLIPLFEWWGTPSS